MSSKINDKQELFCQEYAKHGNATRAYLHAYPTSTQLTAESNASRLMGNARVKERIKELQDKVAKKSGITREKIVEELGRMGFQDVDVDTLRFSEKLKALEILAKMLGFLDGNGNGAPNTDDAKRRFLEAAGRVRTKLNKRKPK